MMTSILAQSSKLSLRTKTYQKTLGTSTERNSAKLANPDGVTAVLCFTDSSVTFSGPLPVMARNRKLDAIIIYKSVCHWRVDIAVYNYIEFTLSSQ